MKLQRWHYSEHQISNPFLTNTLSEVESKQFFSHLRYVKKPKKKNAQKTIAFPDKDALLG